MVLGIWEGNFKYYIMEKFESKSTKIYFKTEDEFWLHFNNLGVRADMPYSIREETPQMTSTDVYCRTVFYYV